MIHSTYKHICRQSTIFSLLLTGSLTGVGGSIMSSPCVPSPNPQASSARSSISSASPKPHGNTLTVSPNGNKAGSGHRLSIQFADSVGKPLIETQNKKHQPKEEDTNEVLPTCLLRQEKELPTKDMHNNIKMGNGIPNTCNTIKHAQDVATSPISPHFFSSPPEQPPVDDFDEPSPSSCSCANSEKSRPRIKQEKSGFPLSQNLSAPTIEKTKNNPTTKYYSGPHEYVRSPTKNTQIRSLPKYPDKVEYCPKHANELHNSKAISDPLGNNIDISEKFSQPTRTQRSTHSDLKLQSECSSSHGNCDRCNASIAELLCSTSSRQPEQHIHNNALPMGSNQTDVTEYEGRSSIVDCYGGGSCSEECYSYSGSASQCSCMGSCDQQSQIVTEDEQSIITGATVGSSLVATTATNDGGMPAITSQRGNEMAISSIPQTASAAVQPLSLAYMSSNLPPIGRKENKHFLSSLDNYSFYHANDTSDDIDLSLVLKPRRNHYVRTLPHPRTLQSANNVSKSMDTIPLEMCQDIPDVLI